MTPQFDVIVVGGGLAGACAAALFAKHAGLRPERIALLADSFPPVPQRQDPPDLRVVAISHASECILRAADAWSRLPRERLCAYERMRVWHETVPPTGTGSLCFDAADIGEPNLGFIAENSLLVDACQRAFVEAGGRHIAAAMTQLSIGDDIVSVHDAQGNELTARLIVGADGAQSSVRTQSRLTARTLDYQQVAIVGCVKTARSHENTAWQRFLRTGPLALLPLFDGASSLVWSVDTGPAAALLSASDEQFSEQLTTASDGVLGTATLSGRRASFPLRSVSADAYVAARCALVGDAAHVVHPLAGQGANLGLLDAAALCEALARATSEREDPGALRSLRRYEQQRRTHNLSMDAAMSLFRTGFAVTPGPGAWLVNHALASVQRSPLLKRAFARQALGLGGELPALARRVAG
jgi:2-polyprenylphenol 6-hydroxylase